ncbi:MAG: glycosyltransferase family 4 protein [Candidatus Eremiobacteraeota bacterium]|nr:glycosyltransferase family 4 protein [Candidatus Eremiobacteraeota bacterium]
MVLAVDARDLASDHRGLGRYARAVVRKLLNRSDVDLVLLVDAVLPILKRKALSAALRSESTFRVASAVPADAMAVWHPWNMIFFKSALPSILTIADVAPFRFPAADQKRRIHQQMPFRDGLSQATSIITISQASAQDIAIYLGGDRSRISITYPGVDPSFTPGEADALPDCLKGQNYFLFVGDPTEERKNFATLYKAFQQAWPTLDGPKIAVVGARGAAPPGVVHLPIVKDTVVRALYRGALATCVPATYEGFGMPVAESMACGTPVIASNASSLPEVAGDAGILLDPLDIKAWRNAMQEIIRDPALRVTLSNRGIAQAAQFTWDRCAEQTLTVCYNAARQ